MSDKYNGWVNSEELNSQQDIIEYLQKQVETLKEVLLDVGSKSHRSEKLYRWYCDNVETEGE